ncbi:MAG: peptide chain release factor N(5)-glutamine methyltransferase [Nevskiales bacterium]
MTLAEALSAAVERLRPHSDSARLDAELLLAHCVQQPRSRLLSHGENKLADDALTRFQGLVTRREMGEPLAYLLKQREFWSLELEVTPAVLIPRPETETLVEAALARIPAGARWRIADLGTGSGAIALAIARERPACVVLATDSSEAALAVAARNAQRHQLGNVEFRRGRWYAALSGEKLELVLSNPPYVAAQDPHLAALAFEPRRALIAGDNGLADLRFIVQHAPLHLKPGGWLLLEHGATQDQAVRELLKFSGFASVETLADLADLPRVTLGQLN